MIPVSRRRVSAISKLDRTVSENLLMIVGNARTSLVKQLVWIFFTALFRIPQALLVSVTQCNHLVEDVDCKISLSCPSQRGREGERTLT